MWRGSYKAQMELLGICYALDVFGMLSYESQWKPWGSDDTLSEDPI